MTAINDATVFVTGANGGLGTRLVEAALARGARRVYAGARNPKTWADERVVPVNVDLGDAASIEHAAKQTGDTSILINNAAIFPHSELLTGSEDELLSVIQTNLVGPINLTRALAPSLVTTNGALVNINSVLSWLAVGKAHSVSKAGLWMATNAFRLELAPKGVHVLGVYPGPMDTPMQPGTERAGMADPADIANAVYDALEAGEYELLTDKTAEQVHGALAAPVTALYPALAKQ